MHNSCDEKSNWQCWKLWGHCLNLQDVILILFNKVLSSISIFWVQKTYPLSKEKMYRRRFCVGKERFVFFFFPFLYIFFVFFPLSFYTLIRLCKGETHKDEDTQTKFFLCHKAEFTRMRTLKGKFCSLWR